MKVIKRAIFCLLLIPFLNLRLVISFAPNLTAGVFLLVVLAVFYVYVNIVPAIDKLSWFQDKMVAGGYELILISLVCFTVEVFAYVYVLVKNMGIETNILILNAIVFCFLFLSCC